MRASVTAAVLALLAGCDRSYRAAPVPPDIVLVVIDTLRADRIGGYGNPRGLTPTIDRLASNGVLFRHAYAPSSWTKPSVASLLCSRYWSQHGVGAFGSILSASEVTLPEVLRDHGYATAGF